MTAPGSPSHVLNVIQSALTDLESGRMLLSEIIPKVIRSATLLGDHRMVARFKLELIDSNIAEEVRPIFTELRGRISADESKTVNDSVMVDYFNCREMVFGNIIRGDGKKYSISQGLRSLEMAKSMAERIVANTHQEEASDDYRIFYSYEQKQQVFERRSEHEALIRDYDLIFSKIRNKAHTYLVEAETTVVAAATAPTPVREADAVNAPIAATVDARKVFVAYGQNERAKEALFTFLRAADLNPLEWEKIVQLTIEAKGQGSPYIGDILEVGMNVAQAVVILLTGDEVATLLPEFAKSEDDAKPHIAQPRPNVLYEAGLAMGKYPERTVIVQMGKVREMSDLTGRHAVRIDDTAEKRHALLERLRSIKCAVDTSSGAWIKAGTLS